MLIQKSAIKKLKSLNYHQYSVAPDPFAKKLENKFSESNENLHKFN